ncbi:ferritin-like domain-containing protein [Spirosoma soli]|uniref:Ferritin-like domain-containing protein n=1 Tax=Spirosoma soli TaxID=1770529 RepID=A0ABW5M9T6_9BACT
METMDEVMEHCLQELYAAETEGVKALTKLAKEVSEPKLKQAFERHAEETEKQAQRIEEACELLGITPKGKPAVGLKGLIDETETLLKEVKNESLRDAVIIGAAQKMEHYEIAAYGTARSLAEEAGEDKVAKLLEKTLEEEKNTDEKLTKLAEQRVNKKAVQE